MAAICAGCRNGEAFVTPLSMAFQPIVDSWTGQAYAYEALVRGQAGESAAQVLAEVNEANRYGFDQACRLCAIETAMAAGLLSSSALLSINFLPNAVYSPLACIQLTLKTARQVGLPLERLVFEFTENEAMTAPEHVSRIVESYRQMGFGVAIDDFGAGYSGLHRLARLSPDTIKLDMALIRDIDTDARLQTIVRAIAWLGDALATRVVAEGIETEAEADALIELGVRYHQGFWYARPQLAALPQPQAHWRRASVAAFTAP